MNRIPICSHLFTTVHTCSHLFTLVHTCSHLSDYLRSSRNGSFSLNFLLAKAVIFRSCMLSCWNCIFFAHLIKSYPTVHGLSSCIEINMLIPLAAHTTVTMYACRKMSFFALSKALILQSCRILLKVHNLTRLIESFPTFHGLWSCLETEMSIPLGDHTSRQLIEKGSSAVIF